MLVKYIHTCNSEHSRIVDNDREKAVAGTSWQWMMLLSLFSMLRMERKWSKEVHYQVVGNSRSVALTPISVARARLSRIQKRDLDG